jgi:hypothetical protein
LVNVGFGEEFQGMDERQILVAMYKDIKALSKQVAEIQCPSPRCQMHDRRITDLERNEEDRKDDEKEKQQRSETRWDRGNIVITILLATIAILLAIIAWIG